MHLPDSRALSSAAKMTTGVPMGTGVALVAVGGGVAVASAACGTVMAKSRIGVGRLVGTVKTELSGSAVDIGSLGADHYV